MNLRPDLEISDEGDTTVGLKFLREFEIERQARLAAASHDTHKPVEAIAEQHGEKEENKELFEDEKISDKADNIGIEASVKHVEEQEWKGFSDSSASEKSDQSEPEVSKKAKAEKNDER